VPAVRERLIQRLLALHPGVFQPEDYLDRWLSEPIAELFDRYGVVFQARKVERPPDDALQHVYVEGVYGKHNCVKNAMHHATLTGTSPWYSLALYFEDEIQQFVWWIHCFCMSQDHRTIFDVTIPPKNAPPDAPLVFYAVPWSFELYSLLANGPINRDALPWFLKRSILEALPHLSTPSPEFSF
jgi:hypothetical protein